MVCRVAVIVAATVLLVGGAALATDWSEYAEFRHVSGLPGNGFGVNQDGSVGFGGAFHMNVPCAYTPAGGSFTTGYYCGSYDSNVRLQFGGDESDGMGHIGIGLGSPGRGIYVAEIFVEKHLEVNATNLQWQFYDETANVPALAIGVLDLFDERTRRYGIPHSARSYYVVGTRKVSESDHPVYVSLGFGNGRFDKTLFGGISWYPAEWALLGFEYDGYMPRPHAAFELLGRDGFNITVGGAWSDFDHPVLGLSVNYSR